MSKTTNKSSPEVRERSVRLLFDNEGQHTSRWQAVTLPLHPAMTDAQVDRVIDALTRVVT